MKSQTRWVRSLRGALLAAGIAVSSPAVLAQEAYPARPVTIIIPFTAGSQPDILARALAEHFTKTLGQAFVIANRDGAAGVIGVEALSQAKPDGYTLGYGPQGQFTIQPNLRKNLKYKVDDFEFLCQSNSGMFVVAAGPGSPYNSLAELLEAARKSPGKISFASAGHATGPHLIAESIALEAGVKLNHIPFRSVGDMYTQVIGGQVDFMVTTPVFLTTRKDVKGFAVVADQRLAANPGIPLLKDLGFKRSSLPGYIGLYAPKGLPTATSAALRKACPGAVESDVFKSASEKTATPVFYADAPGYTASIQQDVKYMADLLATLGIKPE
jgi:tripartite-type tricarboxylate transporter receptor subunit TctC